MIKACGLIRGLHWFCQARFGASDILSALLSTVFPWEPKWQPKWNGQCTPSPTHPKQSFRVLTEVKMADAVWSFVKHSEQPQRLIWTASRVITCSCYKSSNCRISLVLLCSDFRMTSIFLGNPFGRCPTHQYHRLAIAWLAEFSLSFFIC